jgi:DNA-binding response OmpR family regulator
MATRVLLTPSVLLVNDALEEREMYARILCAVGYRVIKAENSIAAYEVAATGPPDVLVTDVRLAGSISGLELTRRMRITQRTSTVGIIVLTTASRPQDADVALKAGADAVLEKPVTGSALKAEIATLLPTSRRLLSDDPTQHQRFRPGALDLRRRRSSLPTATDTRCPSCGSTVVFRERWPVLSSEPVRPSVGGERMRYVSGWFCTNPECDNDPLSRDAS